MLRPTLRGLLLASLAAPFAVPPTLAQGDKPPALDAPAPPRPPAPPGRPAPARPAPPATAPAPAPAGDIALRPADAATRPALQTDTPVRVTLTRGQAAFFRVSPDAGAAYVVTTRRLGPNTDTLLRTLDAAGATVSEDDDGGEEGLASRVEVQPSDNVVLLRAGTLGDAGGTFEVVLTRDAVRPPPEFATSAEAAASRPPLALDQPVALRLRSGQSAFFRLPEDRTNLVAITRNLGRGTDTVLALLGPNGEELANDDDGGGGLASLLPLAEGPNATILRAGTLGGVGEFELLLIREAPAPPPDFATSWETARDRPPLAVGSTTPIRLGRRQSAYFALPEGADIVAITRDLESGADTTLALLDSEGRVLLEDDDGGGDLASRVATADVLRPAAFLRAGVLGNNGGVFSLVVQPGAPQPPAGAIARDVAEAASRPALILGEAIALRLRPGEAAVFSLPFDGRDAIALTFGLERETDTVLELLDARGESVSEDDDGGDGLASRLAIPAEPRPAYLRVRILGERIGRFNIVLVRPAP